MCPRDRYDAIPMPSQPSSRAGSSGEISLHDICCSGAVLGPEPESVHVPTWLPGSGQTRSAEIVDQDCSSMHASTLHTAHTPREFDLGGIVEDPTYRFARQRAQKKTKKGKN